MPAAFAQTLRALDGDRPRRTPAAVAVCALLGMAWLAWATLGRVTVYEVSTSARLETYRAAHTVDAPVAGRIVSTKLALGTYVKAGETLIELESDLQRGRLVEETARLARLEPEIEAGLRVLHAREETLANEREASLADIEGARARRSQAKIASALSDEELSRTARLRDGGAVSELELLRASAEASRRQAASRESAFDVLRRRGEQRTRASEMVAQIEELRRDLASLEGRRATTQALVAQLTVAIDQRTLKAPVDGRMEDVAPLAVGSYVREGERVGAVIPTGELRIVSEFTPFTSVGRVRPGQRARVRFDGYPWTQFGGLSAKVASVASEVRGGRVRVELDVLDAATSRIPLQHGMTNTVEIEVERVSPAALALRAIGSKLSAERAEAPTTATEHAP